MTTPAPPPSPAALSIAEALTSKGSLGWIPTAWEIASALDAFAAERVEHAYEIGARAERELAQVSIRHWCMVHEIDFPLLIRNRADLRDRIDKIRAAFPEAAPARASEETT